MKQLIDTCRIKAIDRVEKILLTASMGCNGRTFASAQGHRQFAITIYQLQSSISTFYHLQGLYLCGVETGENK